MKKNDGVLKRASGYVSERNASSRGLFESMYNVDVAIREFETLQAKGNSFKEELAELDMLEKQLSLLKPGAPEYENAKKRFDDICRMICEDPSPEPAGFGKTVTEALLKLKYVLLHVTYMVVLRLLIVVFNVAALIGLIYFLPTFLDWLF